MSAGNSLLAPPNQECVALSLKGLLLLGATLLFAGVLLYCWSELRNAAWIGAASNKVPTPPSTPSHYEEADRWYVLLDSVGRQQFWAGEVLIPLGAGMLFGSLAGFALLPDRRFGLSTLFLATLYLALLLGIPFGLVRPHLQNPRLWYQGETGDIAFSQSAPNKFDPSFVARYKFLLLERKSIPLFLLPLLLIPLAVFVLARRPKPVDNA